MYLSGGLDFKPNLVPITSSGFYWAESNLRLFDCTVRLVI